jgi:hypothetical protein
MGHPARHRDSPVRAFTTGMGAIGHVREASRLERPP